MTTKTAETGGIDTRRLGHQLETVDAAIRRLERAGVTRSLVLRELKQQRTDIRRQLNHVAATR